MALILLDALVSALNRCPVSNVFPRQVPNPLNSLEFLKHSSFASRMSI